MKKRGRGIATMFYPVGFTSYPNPATAFIKMNEDGTVIILTGAKDIGQGSTTILAQIAAEVLGVKYEDITIVSGDTKITPYDLGTVASRVTYVVGNAIMNAAMELRDSLFQVAAAELDIKVAGLAAVNGDIYVKGLPERRISIAEVASKAHLFQGTPPIGSGTYNPVTTFLDPETGHGKAYGTHVFATQIADVEVDIETGEVDLIKIVAVHDCVTAINPMLVRGQIDGGVGNGVGYALTEEMVVVDGIVKNPGFTDYILPTALDVPEIISGIVERPDSTGPFGAKGVGEPSLLPTAPAIINAIYDAVGVRIVDLPATPEKILRALKVKEGKAI
ncbi:MAG TPA: molybdopterin-dependent oxidoreductase [Clostridiales bacterium]|nr:molybdopterin-dependent oxidoreductase [Clostridiales bacterium]